MLSKYADGELTIKQNNQVFRAAKDFLSDDKNLIGYCKKHRKEWNKPLFIEWSSYLSHFVR